MEDSNQFYYLQQIIRELHSDAELVFTASADKNSNYYKLYSQIKDGTSYDHLLGNRDQDKKRLRTELADLKKQLIKHTMSQNETKYDTLKEIDHLIRLGFIKEAFKKIEELEKILNKEDFWIQWRLGELKLKHEDWWDDKEEIIKRQDYLYNLAKNYAHWEEDHQTFNPDSTKTEFYLLLKKFKADCNKVENEVVRFLEELKECRRKCQTFKPELTLNHLASITTINNELVIKEYFHKAFKLLDYLLSNQIFLKQYHSSLFNETLKEVHNESFILMSGCDVQLANSFTLYCELMMANLQTSIVLINTGLSDKEWKKYADIFEIDSEDIATRIQILRLIGRIFTYDGFTDKTFSSKEILVKKLPKIWEELKALLDKNKDVKLSEEVRIGLKSLYVISVRILRKNDISSRGISADFKKQIEDNSGTENRYSKELQGISIYKRILSDKESVDYSEAKNILQLAAIKLDKLVNKNEIS